MNGLKSLDGVIYINLEHRLDRKNSLLKELRRVGVNSQKITKVSGVYTPLNGRIGCYLGHIQALSVMEKSGWRRALILEDDAQFCSDQNKIDSFLETFWELFGDEWDVLLLGGRYLKVFPIHNKFFRVLRSLQTHAYLVNGPYATSLMDCFQRGYEKIKNDIFIVESVGKSIDVRWWEEQRSQRWFAPVEALVKQSEGYSDIVHGIRNKTN